MRLRTTPTLSLRLSSSHAFKEYASSATEKLEASGLTIGVKHIENPIKPEKEAPQEAG
jgi:hypothetical protein